MKMNVQILSKELVKPSTPTPPSLKNYKISLIDELSPKMNVPLILYYPSDKSISTCEYLKDTLATTLNQFYLLAGRYVKDSHTVDCNDQGVEFVKAQANFQLNDLIGQTTNIKIEFLNDLIPSSFGALDEITDPLLSIQLTVFDCGGLAIGVCVSHRVADLSTISTFLGEWAMNTATWGTLGVPQIPYSFDSALFFPGKNMPGLQLGFSRSKENIHDNKIATRVFCFNNKAISSIKGKATRVQSVLGIIWKAIVDINKAAKHGPSSDFIVIQPVNMREKTIPPFPKYSCGNLYMSSVSQYFSNEKEMGFQDFANLLSNSVKSTLEDCAKILSCGEEGQMMLINPFVKVHNITLSKPDVSTCCFTSWCRFPFYETNFGWGKPVWVSTMNPPLPNSVILIDDKEGEGIEAWVSLDENDMNKFQENCIIKKFTT